MNGTLTPLADFAKQQKRTVDCVYKWKWKGRLNRFTGLVVKCEMTRLPSGAWAISQQQYDEFIFKLNRKP